MMVEDDYTPLPPATPPSRDAYLPTGHLPRLRRVPELRIVTLFGTIADMVAAWGRYCDGESLVVFTRDLRPVGERALVTIALESGQQALRGTCEVVESYAEGKGPYDGRAAMRLRFESADQVTRTRLAEMGAASRAAAEMQTMKLDRVEHRGTFRMWRVRASTPGVGTVKVPRLAELSGLPMNDALRTQRMSIDELRALMGAPAEDGPDDDRLLSAVVIDETPGAGVEPADAEEHYPLPRLRRLGVVPTSPVFWAGCAVGAGITALFALLW